MRILSYPLLGLALAATAAHAQEASDTGALPDGPEADAAAPANLPPSEPAAPADTAPADQPLPPQAAPPAESAPPETSQTEGAEFTDEQVDQFAEATVKVQAIDADASIAAEEKQARMAAAVTGTGLDPATYNKIGRAVAVDPELRNRVQVAMTRHAGADPTDG